MSDERKRAADAVRDAIRELRIELVVLNDRIAREAGLYPRDLDILDVIDREGPCTPSQIAARTGWRRATLTGVLARLEADGWIIRNANPADGRSATVESTNRFRELERLYRPTDAGVTEVVSARAATEVEHWIDVTRALIERAKILDVADNAERDKDSE